LGIFNFLEPISKSVIFKLALAVFQVFTLAKLRSLRLLSQNFSFGKASVYNISQNRKKTKSGGYVCGDTALSRFSVRRA
jgi:hypothetical protein